MVPAADQAGWLSAFTARILGSYHGDMNLKITLSIDWFGPHHGKFHTFHSTGGLLMRIDNLPASMTTFDRHCSNIYLLGVLPGPKEATIANFQKFMDLLVQELRMLDEEGLLLPTVRCPEGELVRLRLHQAVADSPARAKFGGFSGRRTTGPICPICPQRAELLGMTEEEIEERLAQPLRKYDLPTTAAAHVAALDDLPYFEAIVSCPVDVMHAMHLGICKRFWLKFLITGCKDMTIDRKPPLRVFQRFSLTVVVPTAKKLPKECIDDSGGCLPTAEEWTTLYRVHFPFAYMQIFSQSLTAGKGGAFNFKLKPRERSKNRHVAMGSKPVKDVFRCLIEVYRLEQLIRELNEAQSEMLGLGWLTFNSHAISHLADFIRRFGGPWNFSCLPFERYNGMIGKIHTSGQKGGILERTFMRLTVSREQLLDVMEDSPNATIQALYAQRQGPDPASPQLKTSPSSRRIMTEQTIDLLLALLNGSSRNFGGLYQPPNTHMYSENDVRITRFAEHFRTYDVPCEPDAQHLSGAESVSGY